MSWNCQLEKNAGNSAALKEKNTGMEREKKVTFFASRWGHSCAMVPTWVALEAAFYGVDIRYCELSVGVARMLSYKPLAKTGAAC